MRTKTIKIYKLHELPEDVQKKAHENYNTSQSFDYAWIDEYRDSLKAFEELFPVKVKNYSWGTCSHSYIDWEFEAGTDIGELSGWRLATYIWNNYRSLWKGKYFGCISRPWSDARIVHRKLKHSEMKANIHHGHAHYYQYFGMKLEIRSCPFTGFCGDEDLLDPIWKFLEKPDGTTFEELIGECMDSLTKSVVADMEYQESFEYFEEHCSGNEYEFTEDGKRV